MPSEDEMTSDERGKYLKKQQERSRKATRQGRGELLPEMEQVTGLHRKSLTRLMNATSLERKKRRTPRQKTSSKETEQVIVRVWQSLPYVCAERLTPAVLPLAQQLASFGEVRLSAAVQEQLAQVSRATVGRILRAPRARKVRLPQKGVERATQVTTGVPMGRLPWDTREPGHLEVDLVSHRVESPAGLAGQTIQLLDVATGWSERVVVMGRGQAAMEGGLRRRGERVPFALLELHPEHGRECFNQHRLRFWKQPVKGVRLSRSRPYQKNDHRMVEQKNDTLLRQDVGQLRLDIPEQVAALKAFYEPRWLSYHLFQPVLHLCEKVVVGDKVHRTWDEAKTPYERLRASGVLTAEPQVRLQQLYEQPHPLQLRQALYRQVAALWEAATAHPGQVDKQKGDSRLR